MVSTIQSRISLFLRDCRAIVVQRSVCIILDEMLTGLNTTNEKKMMRIRNLMTNDFTDDDTD